MNNADHDAVRDGETEDGEECPTDECFVDRNGKAQIGRVEISAWAWYDVSYVVHKGEALTTLPRSQRH